MCGERVRVQPQPDAPAMPAISQYIKALSSLGGHQKLVLKGQNPGQLQKLAQIQQLPVYSETEEVAKILKELLDDIHTCREVLNKVDGSAKKLMDEAMDKMVRL